jgi:hypothetical protein
MLEATHPTTIDELLGELEQVLAEERLALIRVDAENIDRFAQRKSELSDLLALRRAELTQAHQQRFKTIQLDVRHNIILLVHAREYVQTRLALLTGRVPTLRPFSKTAAEPVRLDLRG